MLPISIQSPEIPMEKKIRHGRFEELASDFGISSCPTCNSEDLGIAFGRLTCEGCERVMTDGVWIPWEVVLFLSKNRPSDTSGT